MEIADVFRLWGQNVRDARCNLWSQKDLAVVCGIDASYICNIEAGRRVPTDRVKIALAGALRRTVTELFPWPDEIPPFPMIRAAELSTTAP